MSTSQTKKSTNLPSSSCCAVSSPCPVQISPPPLFDPLPTNQLQLVRPPVLFTTFSLWNPVIKAFFLLSPGSILHSCYLEVTTPTFPLQPFRKQRKKRSPCVRLLASTVRASSTEAKPLYLWAPSPHQTNASLHRIMDAQDRELTMLTFGG